MAGITGMSDITDLLNMHGALYGLTPEDTPLLSSIGSLTGGKSTDSTIFGWQTYDLRTASQPGVLDEMNTPGYVDAVAGREFAYRYRLISSYVVVSADEGEDDIRCGKRVVRQKALL